MKHIELAVRGRLMNNKAIESLVKKDPKAAERKLKELKAKVPKMVAAFDKAKEELGISTGQTKVYNKTYDRWHLESRYDYDKVKKLKSAVQRDFNNTYNELHNLILAISGLTSELQRAAQPKVPKPPIVVPSDEEMRNGEYKRMMESFDAKVRRKALEWRWTPRVVKGVKWGKYGGDDMYSYAVFVDGRPLITGDSLFNKNVSMKRGYEYLAKRFGIKDNLTGEIPK